MVKGKMEKHESEMEGGGFVAFRVIKFCMLSDVAWNNQQDILSGE